MVAGPFKARLCRVTSTSRVATIDQALLDDPSMVDDPAMVDLPGFFAALIIRRYATPSLFGRDVRWVKTHGYHQPAAPRQTIGHLLRSPNCPRRQVHFPDVTGGTSAR